MIEGRWQEDKKTRKCGRSLYKTSRGARHSPTNVRFLLAATVILIGLTSRISQEATAELMRSKSTKDPSMADAIIPDWAIGCRRLTPGTPYIEALCEDKRQMVKEPIERFDETGIVTTGGKHREYDVIIVASGYDLTYQVCLMYGRNGVNLIDLYDQAPEAYLGVCPLEMPSKLNRLFPANLNAHYIRRLLRPPSSPPKKVLLPPALSSPSSNMQ
jgi:cation diffusion facilitator CzcD-associated flavoprotein CzcO